MSSVITTPLIDGGATLPSISVVVVSRGRPDQLQACLSSLARQIYPQYEIIVVADPSGLAVVADAPFGAQVKTVGYDAAAISAARNLGIGQAAGQVVAFIDDDACAEPTWLHHLGHAFKDDRIGVAGGYVRGRDGISYQAAARLVDQTGRAQGFDLQGTDPQIVTPPNGLAVKTAGTNMAVRRDLLLRLGGFDEAFHFHLDDTDLALRLQAAASQVALVPLAQVHHADAPSPRRKQNGAITDLFDIGASSAVFLRKHCPQDQADRALVLVKQDQWARVQQQTRHGLIRREDVAPLLKGLSDGIEAGQTRGFGTGALIDGGTGFQAFQTLATDDHCILSGWRHQRRRLMRQAAEAAEKGQTVSLFLFGLNARGHQLGFDPSGVWVQRGGILGRSDRRQRLVQFCSRRQRIAQEMLRLKNIRELS